MRLSAVKKLTIGLGCTLTIVLFQNCGGTFSPATMTALSSLNQNPNPTSSPSRNPGTNPSPTPSSSPSVSASPSPSPSPSPSASPTPGPSPSPSIPTVVGDYNPSMGPSLSQGIRVVNVTNASELTSALVNAKAGDVITLQNGTYRLNQNTVLSAAGTTANPIFVRAANAGMAEIQQCNIEGFKVSGPNWVFEDLVIRGVCDTGGASNAHAFHIVGAASNIFVRNNTVVDFQSHVKLNQESPGGVQTWPANVQFLYNRWKQTHPMGGTDPHNVLNLDGGDGHIIRGNIFYDITTSNTSRSQSAIYPKAGIRNGLVEMNMVVCSKNVYNGNTVRGIQTGDNYGPSPICSTADCANDGMIYRNNIVMHCRGSGNSGNIHVGNERNSLFLHHTTYKGTQNYYFRFSPGPNTFLSNILTNNWYFDGAGRPVEDSSNIRPGDAGLQTIFTNPDAADFSIKDGSLIRAKVQRNSNAPHDFCGNTRGTTTDIGAIDYDHPKALDCINKIKAIYNSL